MTIQEEAEPQVPPAVGEFAIQERTKLLSDNSALRARLAKYEDAEGRPVVVVPEQAKEALDWIEDFIARCNGDDRGSCDSVNVLRIALESQAREIVRLNSEAMYSAAAYAAACEEIDRLKAQPSGVVLPEPMKRGDVGGSGEYGAAMIRGYNACLREVARLNSSPVRAGEQCMCGGSPHTTQCLYEHFLSYSGFADQPLLRYAYFHGANTQCEQPSAGVVDERAAFSKAYNAAVDNGFDSVRDLAQQIWQARAALTASAPNHSEQVLEVNYKRKFECLVEHAKRQEQVISELRYDENIRRFYDDGAVWFWAGNETDNLETLACPIVINAGDLRALLAAAPSAGSQGVDV